MRVTFAVVALLAASATAMAEPAPKDEGPGRARRFGAPKGPGPTTRSTGPTIRRAPDVERSRPARSGDLGRGQRVPSRGQPSTTRSAPTRTFGTGSPRVAPRDAAPPAADRRRTPSPVRPTIRDESENPGRRSGTLPSGVSPGRTVRSGPFGGLTRGTDAPRRDDAPAAKPRSTGVRATPFGTKSGTARDGFVRRGGSPKSDAGPSAGSPVTLGGTGASAGTGSRGGSGPTLSGTAGGSTSGSRHGYGPGATESYRADSDYRSGFRRGYRVGYGDSRRDCYHDYYDHWRFSLSFSFGVGPFVGVRYYAPFHHWVTGYDYAFFYPAPVTYCYVPYGFYCDAEPVYVTRHVYVREEVPVYVTRETILVTEVEERTVEAAPVVSDGDTVQVLEPEPAAGSPATEKFLREASDHFRKAEYYEAATKFRLAALSAPGNTGPLFALGQSLLAMGEDAYAARVLRRAVIANPDLLKEPGDLAGVYGSQEEYDRVVAALEKRAAAAPPDGDARFLLGYERYFAGDPRARVDFAALAERMPEDQAVTLLGAAADRRFPDAGDLPEVAAPAGK